MTNAHGTFIWYELLTTDPDAATDFYGKVVGWQARGAGQPGMDYRLWSMGDGDVGGLMKLPEMDTDQGLKPKADLARLCRRRRCGGRGREADRRGCAVHMRPTDIPGVGRFAFVADPQGVLFYVMRGEPGVRADHTRSWPLERIADAGLAGGLRFLRRSVRLDQGRRARPGADGHLLADRSWWHHDRSNDEQAAPRQAAVALLFPGLRI